MGRIQEKERGHTVGLWDPAVSGANAGGLYLIGCDLFVKLLKYQAKDIRPVLPNQQPLAPSGYLRT